MKAFRSVQIAFRLTKALLLKVARRSDYKRWTNSNNLETWWSARTEKIAALIPGGVRVIEFGAGRRHLEKLLEACAYFPSDLVDRGPGTIICDLNKRPLPDLKYLAAGVSVCAGVLEYIGDLRSIIEVLSKQVSSCIASYECGVPAQGTGTTARQR